MRRLEESEIRLARLVEDIAEAREESLNKAKVLYEKKLR